MARHAARPGRRLILFALVVLALFAGLSVAGQWQPKLGLDLQGGTRITLEARLLSAASSMRGWSSSPSIHPAAMFSRAVMS